MITMQKDSEQSESAVAVKSSQFLFRDVVRNPQPGDTVLGRKVTRRNELWVEYEKGQMKYTVRLETWIRCVCGKTA
jgi:hypothetical protein